MRPRSPRWTVLVAISPADSLEVHVAEERWEITPSGDLQFTSDGEPRRAYAKGQWLSVEPHS